MSFKCIPYVTPSGVPYIRPPTPPPGPERPRLPVMTVNGVRPDANGDLALDLSGIEENAAAIAELGETKADKDTTYTKSEVDSKIAGVQTFGKAIVQTLPDVAGADDKLIYLVPRADSETPDLCDEFTVVETDGVRRWERIGGTTVDLSAYYTKTEADEKLAGKLDAEAVADAYDATSTYAVGDTVTHDGRLYECNTAISSPEVWTAAHWTEKKIGGGGTGDYNVLENKPSINGNTLSGNKTAADLGLASSSDLSTLQAFYLAEKRKIDPRFGVADNITVVIDTAGVRHEVVTEGEFVPTGYGQDAHAEEIYLAPSVNAIGEDVNAEFTYTRKIVCYGNITSISRGAFGNAYFLDFLSLAGQGQTDTVANGWVDFSMCASSILVVIPDVYYQDETSTFWRWADYTQGAGGVNYLRMCNFAKASNPRRNPYIVETSYAASGGTQEKFFIIPDYQWDVKWAKRWGEHFFFEEGDLGNVALNDICGASVEYGSNYQATLSNADVMMGRLKTTGVDCSFPFIDSSSDGVTIEAVVSGFGGYAANVDFGGMKIEGRTLQILNSSGYDMALSAYSTGASLTSFVFRASRAGASFQWLLNLGRAVFTTPEEWDVGDYSFVSDGLHIACDNGQESFSFYALRIYNAFLTDAQIMEHARLDAERFNLTEGI